MTVFFAWEIFRQNVKYGALPLLHGLRTTHVSLGENNRLRESLAQVREYWESQPGVWEILDSQEIGKELIF